MGTLSLVVRQNNVIRTKHADTGKTIDVLVVRVVPKNGLELEIRESSQIENRILLIGDKLFIDPQIEIEAYRRPRDSWVSWGCLVYRAPLEYEITRGTYIQDTFQRVRP